MTLEIELFQGDSSDIISVKVYSEGEQVVGTDLLNDFSGVFSVVKKLGGDVLLQKNMTAVDDSYRSFISPAESQALAVGNYIGIAEITNDSNTYRKEKHVKIAVRKQGVVITP